jgi:hypothetical protein
MGKIQQGWISQPGKTEARKFNVNQMISKRNSLELKKKKLS